MTNEVAELSHDDPDTANPISEGFHTPAGEGAGTAAPTHTNEFTARKTAAHAMMDAALFMANISQLRMLFTNNSDAIRFFVPLLCLIVFSLFCQILFAIVILMIWARETRCRDPSVPSSSPNPSTAPPPNRRLSPDSDSDSPDNQPLTPDHNGAISYRHRLDIHPDSSLFHGGRGAMIEIDSASSPRMAQKEYDVKFDVFTRRLQIVTLLLVFLITVANMFITGLGFDSASELKAGLNSQ